MCASGLFKHLPRLDLFLDAREQVLDLAKVDIFLGVRVWSIECFNNMCFLNAVV